MLCTRWDDYNTYIIKIGIPSIATTFAVCAAILHTYQYILGISSSFFTYMFDFLTILFICICVYAYIYSYKNNWAIVTVKIIIALVWIIGTASLAIFNTISQCASITSKHKGIFYAHVLHTEHKRYTTAAILQCTGTSGTFKAYSIFNTHYQLHTGDTVVFSATAYPTRSPEDLHNLYLARKGICAVFYLNQDAIMLHTVAPVRYPEKIQNYIKHILYTTYSTDAASLFAALYLGNREYIHPHVQFKFKEAGVLHVLAASGLHVGIIIFGIMAFCRLVFFPKNISVLLTTVAICAYLFISDQPVSLIRASLMCVAGALCIVLNAQKHSINILCITACIILCLYPYELFSAGFQLSFLATAGILLMYNSYHKGLKHFYKAAAPLAVTFSAQLCTMPVSVYHFQELSVTSFIANLVVIPLVSLYMVAGLLTPVMIYTGTVNLYAYCINQLYTCIISCIQFFDQLHGTLYITSPLPPVLYLIVLLIPLMYKKRANVVILSLLTAGMIYNNQPLNGHIIHYKSDNSCYVAQTENGSAQCIMTLNSYRDYSQLVQNLKYHKVTRLSLMLPDASFKSCAYAILLGKQFCLEKIYIGKYSPPSIAKLIYATHIDNIPLYFNKHSKLLQQPAWHKIFDMYTSMQLESVK
ncbi:MAG: ComEC/Rec2 family competence protein [Spirochaetota bacterium]